MVYVVFFVYYLCINVCYLSRVISCYLFLGQRVCRSNELRRRYLISASKDDPGDIVN